MDMQMHIKSLGMELGEVATNLMMDKRCSAEALHKIVLALACSGVYPRWEEVQEKIGKKFAARVMHRDWVKLPDYCFSCGRIESSERGHLRESCSDCRNSNPSLRSLLFNVQTTTGYPENFFEYLILRKIRKLPKKPKIPSMQKLWEELYLDRSVTIQIEKTEADSFKRKLSRYKHRRLKDVEEENGLRLRTTVVKETDTNLTLLLTLDYGEDNTELNIKIIG